LAFFPSKIAKVELMGVVDIDKNSLRPFEISLAAYKDCALRYYFLKDFVIISTASMLYQTKNSEKMLFLNMESEEFQYSE
jgi:hypothetical protein